MIDDDKTFVGKQALVVISNFHIFGEGPVNATLRFDNASECNATVSLLSSNGFCVEKQHFQAYGFWKLIGEKVWIELEIPELHIAHRVNEMYIAKQLVLEKQSCVGQSRRRLHRPGLDLSYMRLAPDELKKLATWSTRKKDEQLGEDGKCEEEIMLLQKHEGITDAFPSDNDRRTRPVTLFHPKERKNCWLPETEKGPHKQQTLRGSWSSTFNTFRSKLRL